MTFPTKVPRVNSQYGAPMGRCDEDDTGGEPTRAGLLALDWVDGDYDPGGAYWGHTRGERIYWLRDAEGKLSAFIRGASRTAAIEQAQLDYPHVAIHGVKKMELV